ncbi:hypothetical protein [Aquimarina pacifica]|uniref:hypothetical protein n=1 Tax=Aquimarina pacifica TaxID=1296415 RepID=UPI000472C458|nr:hypothetical protein [Aquimarina pacifica]
MFFQDKYKIIEFCKIVTPLEGEFFLIKDCFKVLYDFILQSIDKPTSLSFAYNYGRKVWKTKEGFLKAINSLENKDVVNIMAYFNDNRSENYFIINNPIMNLEHPPNLSSISLEIIIDKKYFDKTLVNQLIHNMNDVYSFDYGYINDYRKKQKESKNNSVLEQKWIFHSMGVKEGYIKNVYEYNILNNTQIDQPIIKELIKENIGGIVKLNDQLTIWRLDKSELKVAQKRLNQSQYVIVNTKNPDLFLETEDAKRFRKLMELK